MSTYSLKAQATYLVLGKTVAFAIASVSPIILTRLMETNDYGIYRQVLFLSKIALVLMSLDIHKSLYYAFPRLKESLGGLFSQTFLILSLTSFAGAILLIVLGRFFNFLPQGMTVEYVLPIALWVAIENLAYIIDHIFVLEKKSKLVFGVNCANVVLRLSLVIGAFLVFRQVVFMVYGLVFLSFVRLAVIISYIEKKYSPRFGALEKALLRKQINYTMPLAASNFVWLVGGNIDKGIISAIMSAKDFAIYTVGGLGIMNAVTLIFTAIGDVTVPKFGELAVEKDFEGIRNLWHKMIIINAMITVPFICFSFVFAEQIITVLFTEKYLASANIFRINLMILFIKMFCYGYFLVAIGDTKTILVSHIGRFAVSIPVSIFLIMKMGLIGAALSLLVGLLTEALIQLYAGKRVLKVAINQFLPWAQLTIILILSITASFFIQHLVRLGMSGITTLLGGAVIYFPFTLFLFNLLGYFQFRDFRGILKRS